MKILTNPVLLRATVVLFCGTFAFLLGLLFMRMLRKSITEEGDFSADAAPSMESMPLHVFDTVIQQLKQQKNELQEQSQTEQRRARTNENFSQAVLSNLSCGVLVFGTNGLVTQSNPAAKQILGFASSTGMGADDLFRGEIAAEVHSVLREGSARRQLNTNYTTPSGEKRRIAVTVSPVPAVDGSLLGAACLITDLSAFEQIRVQQEMRALELRTSLTTISGYAQQLARNRDPELAQQLAADIAQEAVRLDRSVGGFLTEKSGISGGTAQAASASKS